MQVIKTIAEFKDARRQLKGTLGLVPTMGYLHEGHIELVRRAKSENDVVAVSIFVNPAQFGPNEDFARYPRAMSRDLDMLEKAGTGLVFAPEVTEMYPLGFDTYVKPGAISKRLEGEVRPGHFSGVDTVVAKLFNIVQPTRAYFGAKDAQQVLVIKKMVVDLNFPLEMVVVPTVREADGLAMSSRNTYLNPQERKAALVLSQALALAQKMWANGSRDADDLRTAMVRLIGAEPLAQTDYVSIAKPETLEELTGMFEGSALISMAVRIGKTRLIDNATLG